MMQYINLEETRGEMNCIAPGHPPLHHSTVENKDERSLGKSAGLVRSANHVREKVRVQPRSSQTSRHIFEKAGDVTLRSTAKQLSNRSD